MSQLPDETAVFLVHTLKQILYGFDRLDAIADHLVAGSAAMSFYLGSIYNYVALLFLLDKNGASMGGSVYRTLRPFELEHLLDSMQSTLETRIGSIAFGEAIRIFRNNAIVHSTHSDADLDRVYSSVDMSVLENQLRWQELMHQLRDDIRQLSVDVARSTGRPLSDFGIGLG